MKRIIQVSAFWKNDQEAGIGVTLTQDIGDLDQMLATLEESWNAMWRESVRDTETGTLTQDLLSQLAAIAQCKKERPLSLQNALMVIGNVWLLTKVGAIQPDEFNGLQVIYG